MLQGVSVLELCLMVAMKNVDEINNGEPFNFEMVYEGQRMECVFNLCECV